ncbi:MAG: Unknown protein [uncultured Sulfurovum sp.]|uniref:Uncharacterized protein n=1 Tax=uncultured Sulfurovum sp. TaxID=269237 RepID=A0A6S6T2U4_9BACT|nr:MAG: Unknown protein [uncultured Sulfurovum sp.]
MKRKLLTTTLLAMSLLSLNLSAGNKMKCTGTHCIVDVSDLSPKSTKVESQKISNKKESYSTVILDNIETIVFAQYVMTNDEIAEYDLKEMQKNLLIPTVNSEGLPSSDYLCEDNLKPVFVKEMKNTYKCA